MENGGGADLGSLNQTLVVFDPDGIVARCLAAEMALLEAGRARLRVYAPGGRACGEMGRILLNGTLPRERPPGPRPGCAGRLEPALCAGMSLGDRSGGRGGMAPAVATETGGVGSPPRWGAELLRGGWLIVAFLILLSGLALTVILP